MAARLAGMRNLVAAITLTGAVWSAVPHVTASASGEPAKGDRALGEYLSAECVTCHQMSGDFKGIPAIVGWPEASFIEIMQEYRHRKRPNQVMQMIAGRLSEEEIASLAVYFGSLKSSP